MHSILEMTEVKHRLLKDADLCVKCGMCLPHCPTYQKTNNENESPRGRIALIQAWANNYLPASDKLINHIDNCLLCRSCETICPTAVPYAKLIDNFRTQQTTRKHSSAALSLLRIITQNKSANLITIRAPKAFIMRGFM